MDIEANEYVRTNGGHIGIFQKYEEEGISQWFTMLQNGTLYTTATKAIVKHSKNIIDLIEVGDYVNGKYVKEINQYKDGKSIIALIGIIDEKNIKTILTHEQYNANCYKIEQK
jgi:hypothetical protein